LENVCTTGGAGRGKQTIGRTLAQFPCHNPHTHTYVRTYLVHTLTIFVEMSFGTNIVY